MAYIHKQFAATFGGYDGNASFIPRAVNWGVLGRTCPYDLIVTDRPVGYDDLKNLFDTAEINTRESVGKLNRTIARERLPSDPLYNADLTLQNVSGGSRYWVANANDLTQVLATGVVAGTEDQFYDEVIPNVPAYGVPFLLEIRIRNATGTIKYKAFKTYVNHSSAGASAYVIQALDPVA